MSSSVLCETAISAGPEQLIEGSLGTIFQKQVYSFCILKVRVETEHILMLQVLLYLDLPLDLINEVILNHLNLLHRL